MRRNGAEGAAAEAAAVDVDRMLDHLPRRDVALAAVARMRRPFVGKVERPVEFFGRERRVGGVDHHVTVARGFDQYAVRLHEVALRLDAAEIFGEGVRVGRALLVGVQQQPVFEPVDVGAVGEERHLPEFAQQLGVVAVAHRRGYLLHDALAHAVDQQVGTAVDEDRGFERILPIVVVSEPPQRRFDAAHHHRRAGIEPFEDVGVGLDSVVGAEARRTARGVGVVAAQTFVGRIVVDHRVHGPGRHGEEEARRAELAEIAQVVAPVGLRNHRYAVTFCFEQAADDRRAESRMVDVGVAREENDVHRIPAPLAGLLDCGRQKSHRDRLFSFYGFRSASVAECRARTFLFSFRHSLFLLSLPFTLASFAFCGGTPTSRERVRSADGGSGAIFSDCRRPRIPFTKIPAPSGQGGSAASVRNRYNSLSLRRSAFSATIRWSMQSWMSPSMKAARL